MVVCLWVLVYMHAARVCTYVCTCVCVYCLCVCVQILTSTIGGLTLHRHGEVFLLIRLDLQVTQVLLDLARHLGVFIQLLGIEQGAAANTFLVCATLDIKHVGVGASLTQRPEGRKGGRREGEGTGVKIGRAHV